MRDIRQSESYSKYMELLNWEVNKLSGNYVFIKDLKLVSFVKLQRPEKTLRKKKFIDLVNSRSELLVFYIEPKDNNQRKEFEKVGFKSVNSSSLPSKTIRFDLSKSDDELMREMHHKARYNIRLSKRRGVEVIDGDDVGRFNDFWHRSAKKRGMHLSLKKEILSIYKAFGKNAKIIWAKRNHKELASVMILYTKQAGYYMYAASTSLGNKHQAPSLLVWEAIQESKKRGKEYFDFEGIYDERYPIRSWKGFSRFKKSFGGQRIEFPGSMRKFYLPFIKY